MAKVVPRTGLSFGEQVYFIEIFKGLLATGRHALRNLLHPEAFPTLDYPEQLPDIPRDYRARHRLMKRADGTPRCVACNMCSTACPARCIHIKAEASPDSHIEKRPVQFDIDLLLCVFCGYCVEACPCDAIRMDTRQAVMVGESRAEFVMDITALMAWEAKDYPLEDTQSQKAPGGALHAQALSELTSGTGH